MCVQGYCETIDTQPLCSVNWCGPSPNQESSRSRATTLKYEKCQEAVSKRPNVSTSPLDTCRISATLMLSKEMQKLSRALVQHGCQVPRNISASLFVCVEPGQLKKVPCTQPWRSVNWHGRRTESDRSGTFVHPHAFRGSTGQSTEPL